MCFFVKDVTILEKYKKKLYNITIKYAGYLYEPEHGKGEKMNNRTKRLATLGILTGICLILGLTPIGFIPIGPLKITLMCIPVIVGTQVMGLKSGLFLGFMFGLTSLIQMLISPSALQLALLVDGLSWVKMIFITFFARLMIPVVAHLTYCAFRKKGVVGIAVSAVAGSLTNTVLYLGLIILLFMNSPAVIVGTLAAVGVTNGVPEAIFAGIVCSAAVKIIKTKY